MKSKQITDIWKKIKFNPNKPGPMKIIADMDDARFWQQRAVELILESLSIQDQANLREFQNVRERFQNVQVTSPQSVERLVKSARLIIMAAAKIDEYPIEINVSGPLLHLSSDALFTGVLPSTVKAETVSSRPEGKKDGRKKKKARRQRKKA